MSPLLQALWISLGVAQLGVPLAYLVVMRRIVSSRNYHVNLNLGQEPTVSILVPTYNEAGVIETKLENIVRSDYPREKVEIIVVDSGSSDNTSELAQNFFKLSGWKGMVVEEAERKGKPVGLNLGLKHSSGELVCISDAECQWDKEALRNAVKYLSDPSIGSVSGVHQPLKSPGVLSSEIEHSYRSVYRILRIAESKIHSTPLAEGEIQLFRRRELTGFDPTVGGDDTCAALCMIEKGLRAISAQDVVFFEPTPAAWQSRLRQKTRRGQHILQAFLRHKNLLFGRSPFSHFIFPMEFYLYAVNPLFFLPFLALTILILATSPLILYLVTAGTILVLLVPDLRSGAITYVTNNLTMLLAILQELRGEKQLRWKKIDENRPKVRIELPQLVQKRCADPGKHPFTLNPLSERG